MAPVVPVAKFAALAARQLAKPVSQILLRYTLNHPEARARCITVGQLLNRVNVSITRLAEGTKGSRQILDLSEEKALDAGATFLGEVFIFSIGAALLTQEFMRSQQRARDLETMKEEELQAKESAMQARYAEASRRIEMLEDTVNDTRAALDLLLRKAEVPKKEVQTRAQELTDAELERLIAPALRRGAF